MNSHAVSRGYKSARRPFHHAFLRACCVCQRRPKQKAEKRRGCQVFSHDPSLQMDMFPRGILPDGIADYFSNLAFLSLAK
jgi:hypothetical protein